MSLGENIKKYRKENHFTQKELAEKLDVTVRTIQNYESGNREPNFKTLEKIAKAIGISINKLIGANEKINIDVEGEKQIKFNLDNLTSDEVLVFFKELNGNDEEKFKKFMDATSEKWYQALGIKSFYKFNMEFIKFSKIYKDILDKSSELTNLVSKIDCTSEIDKKELVNQINKITEKKQIAECLKELHELYIKSLKVFIELNLYRDELKKEMEDLCKKNMELNDKINKAIQFLNDFPNKDKSKENNTEEKSNYVVIKNVKKNRNNEEDK